jgi:[ribosomal protein S5]-alanine N-acetyltransferase
MLETPWYPFPVLQTERLLLRQLTDDDTNDFFQLRSDERVMKYIDRPLHKTIDETKELMKSSIRMYEAGEGINWGITFKDDPKLIGTIGYYRMIKEYFRVEIGYLLSADHWRKGIMNEAMDAVIDYGFTKMKAHTIIADINPNNAASMMILEKKGFVKEAYFKDSYYINGQFEDAAIYTLFAPTQ